MVFSEKNLNAVLILIICAVLLSAFGVQFFYKEEPCPLCLLQRLGMIGVACGALLNLFMIRSSHYGLILFSAVFGGFVAIRQVSLHACPGFSKFGIPVLGLSLYTWSFIVFVCAVLYTGILLCLHDAQTNKEEEGKSLNLFCKFAAFILLFVTLANVITTFMQCGLGPCVDV